MSEYSWNQFLSEMRSEGYEMEEISDKWSEVKEGEADPEDFLSEGEQGGSEVDSGDSDDAGESGDSRVSGEGSGDRDSSDSTSDNSDGDSDSGSEEVVRFSNAISSGSDSSEEGSEGSEGDGSEVERSDSSSDLESGPSRSDWADSINQGWGMIWSADKEPNTDEWEESTEKVAAIAEQANLGENVSWYIEENFMSEKDDDPKSALVMSLIMAGVMTLPQRPDAVEKIKSAVQPDEDEKEDDN